MSIAPSGSATGCLLDTRTSWGKFPLMAARTVQLVLHYDGSHFAGWQRQPNERTVQGVLESVLERLCAAPTPATGSGRTDAGVHARGQAVGVRVPAKWQAAPLRRALNALLPDDVWVSEAFEMVPEFHARYSAVSRRYSYVVGVDEGTFSPFRRRHEWSLGRTLDRAALDEAARAIEGEHVFRAFAVQGTAPAHDDHRCDVREARWTAADGTLVFRIEANRFLHHMVRFLVGTMVDVARGRRDVADVGRLLAAADNRGVSPPAPARALFLERVAYPDAMYVTDGAAIPGEGAALEPAP